MLVSLLVSPAAAQTRWYDAYREAVRAIERRNWAAAEKLLAQAQTTGQKPSTRAYTYGDTYIRFFPDYYLGVVYLNTSRYREAEAAFARFASQKLITAKDPEYAAFERQSREATFNRSFGEAVQLAAKGELDEANTRLAEARATRIDDGKVTNLASDIKRRMDAATTAESNATETIAAAGPPANAPAPGSAATNRTAEPPPATAPVNTTPAATKTPAAKTPASAARAPLVASAPKSAAPAPMSSAPTDLRDGLLAFFANDYRRAVPLLENAARERGASPRARAFLSCARVALVLTGGASPQVLRQAREEFLSADLGSAMTAADRRYISPRVLEQLERR